MAIQTNPSPTFVLPKLDHQSFAVTSQALEVALRHKPNKARNASVCAVCELCSLDTLQLISCSDSCQIKLQSSRLVFQAVDDLKRNNGC
jgi:hypothetical protein